MKIAEYYSHQGGFEYLHFHHKKLWGEVKSVIGSVDAELCRTKVSKEKRMKDRLLYSPKSFNAAMDEQFRARGWKQERTDYWVTRDAKLVRKTLHLPERDQRLEIEQAGEEAISSYNQTDFVKDRVAVEVQFGKYSFIAFDLFVKHLAFYVGDKIDLGIEILPMKNLQRQMSSGISYYERELYNLIRAGRGNPPVPLVLLGIDC